MAGARNYINLPTDINKYTSLQKSALLGNTEQIIKALDAAPAVNWREELGPNLEVILLYFGHLTEQFNQLAYPQSQEALNAHQTRKTGVINAVLDHLLGKHKIHTAEAESIRASNQAYNMPESQILLSADTALPSSLEALGQRASQPPKQSTPDEMGVPLGQASPPEATAAPDTELTPLAGRKRPVSAGRSVSAPAGTPDRDGAKQRKITPPTSAFVVAVPLGSPPSDDRSPAAGLA